MIAASFREALRAWGRCRLGACRFGGQGTRVVSEEYVGHHVGDTMSRIDTDICFGTLAWWLHCIAEWEHFVLPAEPLEDAGDVPQKAIFWRWTAPPFPLDPYDSSSASWTSLVARSVSCSRCR